MATKRSSNRTNAAHRIFASREVRSAGILGSAIAAAILSTACSGEAPAGGEDLVANSGHSVSTEDGKSYTAPFLDTSTMRIDEGDWDFCHGKATCADGETLTGISVIPDGPGRTALCTSHGGSLSGNVAATLSVDGGQDARRATRAVSGDTDWDFGSWKLECASGEYVSAVSEEATQCSGGTNRFHAVQCSRGSGLRDDGCSARVFAKGDNRGSTTSGDWDSGAYKGECAANEYVAGVSVSPESGSPRALLCCPMAGGSSEPPPPSATPGDTFFGLSSDQGSFGKDQARTLRDLGAGLVRLQFCDWPASKDALMSAVDAARAEGLTVHAEINYCTLSAKYPDSASWHAGFTDGGNDFAWAFAGAAKEIAAAFKGKVFVYEIWNEPGAAPRPLNFPTAFWPSADNADWDGACGAYPYGKDYAQDAWAICPRQLGTLTTNAFMAIKEADGGAKVVAGNVLFHGDNGWVAKEYWKQVEKSPAVNWFKTNKGGVPWDFVGIHPYAYRPTDGTLRAQLDEMKGILGSFGDPAKVAITEYGWHTTPEGGDEYHKASESEQADYLRKTFELAKEEGLGFVTWFNYLDGGNLTYGMRRSDMSWKPSARAFCEVAGASKCPAP